MQAYAIGHLTNVRFGPGVVEYLERIDATLAPFGGRFVIHGGPQEAKEGVFGGTLIVIEFPDIQHARDWYDSPAYRAILPLRTDNAEGAVFLMEGVDASHKATDVLPARAVEYAR